jgi:pyruvate dehydrogenase E1 component alpha subunit
MPVARAFAIDHVAERGPAYGIPASTIDGNDAITVLETVRAAVTRARAGDGPTLIECETYRFKGHSRFEPGRYRPAGELEEQMRHDPLDVLGQRLTETNSMSADAIAAMHTEIEAEVADAITFARSSPAASAADAAPLAFAAVAAS